jgi:hypothetical protein
MSAVPQRGFTGEVAVGLGGSVAGQVVAVGLPVRGGTAEVCRQSTLGFAEAHGRVPRVWETERLALIGREIVPAAARF